MSRATADVAIVGFGPVGAALAALLGRQGLEVVVFDREADIYPLPRAAHIDHTGLRTLQEIGCLESLLPTMIGNPGMDFVTSERRLLFRIPSDQPAASGLPASSYFYQPLFDRALRAAVGKLPSVRVALSTEAVELRSLSDRAILKTIRRDTSVAEEWDVKWIVGCDGAESLVRTAAGIERESFGFEQQWLIYDLLLKDPDLNLPRMAVQVCDPDRPHTELPMPANRYRFEFMLKDGERASDLLRPEVALNSLIAPWVPPGSAEIERTATYVFKGMVARRWRSGRILIAGDAAHLMPPFLGQGMCSGFRDAANLAWKLDRVVRHRAPIALLDTYEAERRPHVRRIIQAGVDLGRLICLTDHEAADERDAGLLADPVQASKRFRFELPPLAAGDLVLAGGGELFPQPVASNGEARLDDRVGQRFLVVGTESSELDRWRPWWEGEIGAFVTSLDKLGEWAPPIASWLRQRNATVAVVRPDRYVLSATDGLGAVTESIRGRLEGEPHGSSV